MHLFCISLCSFSVSVPLSHSLTRFPFLILVSLSNFVSLWLCVSVCVHMHLHGHTFCMFPFPSTLWNLGFCDLAWGFTCITVSR